MDDGEDCEEYYRQRAGEISDWLRRGLEYAAVRDGLFVRLLRAKVVRKTHRDDRTAQTVRDAVARARHELEACRDRAAAAADRVQDQLGRYVDGTRALAEAAGDAEIATVTTLTAQNRRLGEVVRLLRRRLDKGLADVRAAQSRVDVERRENDRIKSLWCSSTSCRKEFDVLQR